MVGRRLHRDHVSGIGYGAQREQQRLLAAVGDDDLLGLDTGTDRVEVVICDLASQRRLAERRGVPEAAFLGPRHDAFHRAMQPFGGRPGHARIRDAERHQFGMVDAVVDALHQRAAVQPHRFAGGGGRRLDDLIALEVPHVESRLRPRLDAALALELDIGLSDRRHADAGGPAHLA